MFASVLVANRGEIGVRIIRTLRTLGVRSVLVTSVPDRHSLAARRADATVLLEGHTAAETYLDIEAVIAAAKAAGCEAVHPGYGFLSESATFAGACAAARLTFIGPSPATLRILGDKIAARDLAIANDVPVIPGASGESDAELLAAADEVGLPIMLKARGGGGGIGMRVVSEGDDLAEAIAGARRQAEAAFGDGRVFIERYVEGAHHVEVQILADAQGNAVHLGERDCSVQRRHQKLIEETPSPVVDSALRAELTSAALRLMEAAGYVNAGTVEFLVGAPAEGGRRPFYFLEVNPRLQVEHPVTEAVTGFDLVAEQLRIAAGEPLAFAQEDVAFGGHAIEFRLNAEDPWHNFLPSPGRLVDLSGGTVAAARLDSGYEAGDTVPAEYDSLLAKLIVHGSDREAALSEAAAALAGARIKGIASNRALHRAIVGHPTFVAGDATIQWLERELPALLHAARPPPEALVAAALLLLEEEAMGFGGSAWLGAGPRSVWLDDGAGVRAVSIARDGVAVIEGEPVTYKRTLAGAGRPVALVGGTGTRVEAVRECSGQILLDCGAAPFGVRLVPPPPLPRRAQAAAGGASEVRAPLAGRVLAVQVEEGDTVAAGALLVVLDAMKMEHAITAPAAGTVRALHIHAEETVESGALLVELD